MNIITAWRRLGAALLWGICVPLAVSTLAAPHARATSVIPPSFNQLVSQSDYIVRGVVTAVNSEMSTDGGRHIITKVQVDVRQVISGTPPQPLVLVMLGGTVGKETQRVEGAPVFHVGDEDILFIHGNGHQLSPLVAMMHGRYPVLHDSAGNEYVARSNGAPLYNEQEVAQPIEEAGVAASPAPAHPLSPAEFVNRIHNAAAQNSASKLEN